MRKRYFMSRLAQIAACVLGIGLLAGCYGQAEAPARTPAQAANEPVRETAAATPAPTPPNAAANSPMVSRAPVPTPASVQGFESGKPHEDNTDKETVRKKSNLQPVYAAAKGTVAITIDDGPTKYTEELLKVLRENGQTKVTFFFLGQNAIAYPDSVTEAVYDGHEIGYHSNSHPKMTEMTFDQQQLEFNRGLSNLVRFDRQPVTLFRPPYGAYNNETKLVTEEHHMKMVLWNEDPRDWSTTDTAVIVKDVLDQVQSGGIIVMHDRPSTIAALPAIIQGIKKKGLKIVRI